MPLLEELHVHTPKSDVWSDPWSLLPRGQRYKYFYLSNDLDDDVVRERCRDILGPGTELEPGEMNGVFGYIISTLRQLSLTEIDSLIQECLSGVAVPTLPDPHASADSTSSAARRRYRAQPSVTTSSSGGVRLPRYVQELAPTEPQREVRRLGDIWDSQRSGNVGFDETYLSPLGNLHNQMLSELKTLEEEASDDNTSVAEVPHPPILHEAWAWYIQNGGALLVFAASLTTALLLILVGQTGIGPAFTAAGWVLAGGTLLTVTVKACVSERPKKKSRGRDVALSRLSREGRRRL